MSKRQCASDGKTMLPLASVWSCCCTESHPVTRTKADHRCSWVAFCMSQPVRLQGSPLKKPQPQPRYGQISSQGLFEVCVAFTVDGSHYQGRFGHPVPTFAQEEFVEPGRCVLRAVERTLWIHPRDERQERSRHAEQIAGASRNGIGPYRRRAGVR